MKDCTSQTLKSTQRGQWNGLICLYSWKSFFPPLNSDCWPELILCYVVISWGSYLMGGIIRQIENSDSDTKRTKLFNCNANNSHLFFYVQYIYIYSPHQVNDLWKINTKFFWSALSLPMMKLFFFLSVWEGSFAEGQSLHKWLNEYVNDAKKSIKSNSAQVSFLFFIPTLLPRKHKFVGLLISFVQF